MKNSPPPKRQRELAEARRLEPTGTADTAPTGNMGVGMELNQEQQVQGEVGYETVTFTNNSSTCYVCWPYNASAYAKNLMAGEGEPSLPFPFLDSENSSSFRRQGWATKHPWIPHGHVYTLDKK
jgi:hypothetical protein